MAKRAKKTKAAKPEIVISMKPSELQNAVKEAVRLKNQQSTYSGYHGQHVKNFCERKGFDKKPFAWLRQLEEMDDLKRQSFIRQFLMGVEIMGYLSQADMFDDVKAKVLEMTEAEKEPENDPNKVGGIGVEGLAAGLKQLAPKDGSDAIDDIAGSVH